MLAFGDGVISQGPLVSKSTLIQFEKCCGGSAIRLRWQCTYGYVEFWRLNPLDFPELVNGFGRLITLDVAESIFDSDSSFWGHRNGFNRLGHRVVVQGVVG